MRKQSQWRYVLNGRPKARTLLPQETLKGWLNVLVGSQMYDFFTGGAGLPFETTRRQTYLE